MKCVAPSKEQLKNSNLHHSAGEQSIQSPEWLERSSDLRLTQEISLSGLNAEANHRGSVTCQFRFDMKDNIL